jgi:hypothetical protein
MADNTSQDNTPQGNIKSEYNVASTGLNLDNSVNQIAKGQLTYALNASVENFDASSVSYQNEPGNEFCIEFPAQFILIGTHFIVEQSKHIFFITNPETGACQIGYMENNDCVYKILVSAPCLAFDINYPIHKVVHKITNCTTELYWTDGLNPRRYLDINNIPYILQIDSDLCDPSFTDQLDCNQLKLQPNFNIPELTIVDVRNGGDLISGTYQFAIQYCDASGNEYTSYYSVTNPTPIADIQIVTPNFNYAVGKSIVVNINNLDATGQFQYFNLAVIKTINNIPSVELVGTYFIDEANKNIIYTGQNQTQIRLTINDIFLKYPYYEIAQDLTSVQDILIWDNLTSIDRINYQSIASQITLQWQTYKLPATENYSDELNATNLRGYMRDEVYAFEIVFLLRNGKQTDGFHIPGREKNSNEAYPDVLDTNEDFIGEGPSAPYWKIYNTASVIGPAVGDPIGNATPYEYGEFAYWESEDVYPCNIDLWGDLADQPIRHHKFPDVLVSPHYESALFAGPGSALVMQNDAVFPIGVIIDTTQVLNYINSSNLTNSQKADIVGYKIIRGDRGTNKSVIAKGILRNVGEYEREEQKFYFPNYPYNDLNVDPFLNENNNAWSLVSEPFLVRWLSNDVVDGVDLGYATCEYTDVNSNKLTTKKIYPTGGPTNQTTGGTGVYEFCSITRPISKGTGKLRVGPANYDVWDIYSDSGLFTCGHRAGWNDPFNDDNIAGTVFREQHVYNLGAIGDGATYTIVVVEDGEGPRTTRCGTIWLIIGTVKCCEARSSIRPPKVFALGEVETPPGIVLGAVATVGGAFPNFIDQNRLFSRRSSLNCKEETPLAGVENKNNHLQIFNSPETSFGQPFLGDVLKLENVMFGAGKAHFVQVKSNAKYKLLSKEAQQDALESANRIGNITSDFNATAMFTAYQAYLTIYVNGITRKNYAYSYNSIANYDYSESIPNDLGIKQRDIDYTQYLIPAVQSVGDINGISMNNFQRESSVFIRTIENRNTLPVSGFSFPSDTFPMISTGVTDKSKQTISSSFVCATPAQETDISVVSYYASMKNMFVNQWGQIYSYDTVDTGFQTNVNSSAIKTIFGGDTFISRFAFKTKLPFFIDNRVNAPDDSDVFYDEIGNIAYPKYWHSARSILDNYQISSPNNPVIANIISYKAHNFDCPSDPASYPPIPNADVQALTGLSGTYRTYYDGYFYLFAYGIPNFYCETSYNLDLRQAFNNKEGDFWPHVTTGIPDDWVQESYVSIANDNTYTYNVTFSKQNKENTFTHLPPDWTTQLCYTNFPFRAIYSDTQNQNADVRVNNWLIYRPIAQYDFPQNYGNLTSLDGIQNKAVLARFENKSLLYNTMLTINTSNPQAAYLGNDTLFKSSPPIDFAETDLGYVGSQNKFLLKIPQGQITVDAKRGQIFLVNSNQAEDLSAFGSGLNRFFTDHLAFEILRYFPNKEVIVNNERIVIPGVNIDNNFTGVGLHGVYDSKYDRIIITKLDYIPIDPYVKYNSTTKQFYVEETINDIVFTTQVYLTDPEYFCNKSWTLSFNFNTKSWISFHSYIPNWYIAENNFFYSGINGCCSDIEGEFEALVGDTNKLVTTTTTQVPERTTSTTTTVTTINCNLAGIIFQTSCELSGDAIITVPPSTTTTVCTRPSNLNSFTFASGYQIGSNPAVDSTVSFSAVCEAMLIVASPQDNLVITLFNFTTEELSIGQVVYYGDDTNDCTLVSDGWYYTSESQFDQFAYYVESGVITEIEYCICLTTTTSTTIISVPECCGILFSSGNNIYYSNDNTNMTELNVPGYSSSFGIAMTSNYLWSVTTQFSMWDITLSPFSATFNTTIPFPGTFTTSSGIVALNNTTLVAIDDSATPEDVVELTLDCNVNPPVFTSTVQFSLQTDRTAIGNMLYTVASKLIVINQDTVTSDYYLTQYDYATGVIELDLNIGSSIIPTSIFQCECLIYITDNSNNVYVVNPDNATPLLNANITSQIIDSAAQVVSCTSTSLIEPTTTTTSSSSTTTSTSTSSTTTTSTTTP